jgi:hypothetical protein
MGSLIRLQQSTAVAVIAEDWTASSLVLARLELEESRQPTTANCEAVTP